MGMEDLWLDRLLDGDSDHSSGHTSSDSRHSSPLSSASFSGSSVFRTEEDPDEKMRGTHDSFYGSSYDTADDRAGK